MIHSGGGGVWNVFSIKNHSIDLVNSPNGTGISEDKLVISGPHMVRMQTIILNWNWKFQTYSSVFSA